jgi:probable HAF family extracellular repeat protein
MLRRIHLPALLVVGLSCAPAAAQVVMYTVTDLGSLGGASEAMAISQNGQITGISDLPGDQAGHAFRIPLGGHIGDPGTDLGTLGGANSAGFGINDAGQVTGQAQLANSAYHAYRTSPGGKISDPGTDLGTYGGLYSIGYGINASGQVTGQGDISGVSPFHAFRTTTTGTLADPNSDLGSLAPGTNSSGNGINDVGQVTGWSDNASGARRAFRTTAAGKVSDPGTDLGSFGGDTYGNAINALGQVVGYSYLAPGGRGAFHAFRTTPTGLVSDPGTDLGTLGGTMSQGIAMNDNGTTIGNSTLPGDAVFHAFIFDTQMIDLNSLIPANSGWVLQYANGINDAGLIVGGGTFGGTGHAFLLTPVPEPGSLALLAAAMGAGIAYRRRRHNPGGSGAAVV